MIQVAIAEDDYRVSLIHERYLSHLDDIEVVGRALNMKETLELLENHTVDLLLLDIYFPDQLGIDALPDIRKRYPNLDILIITASSDKRMLETARRNGVIHYLLKPVTLEKFQETITRYRNQINWLADDAELDQAQADLVFEGIGNTDTEKTGRNQLPTGIDAITLDKVRRVFAASSHDGMNTEMVCKSVGISRTTARRYLEFLVSTHECETIINYGVIGRPERLYRKK